MATLDIVTVTEAKDRLGGSVVSTGDDAAIQSDISALSAVFDRRYGAAVEREIVEPVVGPYSDDVYPNRYRVDIYVPAILDFWPIVGTPTVDAGTVIVRNRQFGRVELSTSSATTVTYTAGRFADTASVSEQFKAAFIVALRNWRQADHAAPFVPAGPDYPAPRTSFPTFAVPRACDHMLAEYMRPSEGLA